MGITSPFFSLFGQSPIKPLQQHMAKVTDCTEKLVPFMDAVIAENWEEAQTFQIEIASLENEADEIKRDLRLHLPRSLFLPIPRGDVLFILAAQDNIANKAEDLAGLIIGRHMKIPKEIQSDFYNFLLKSVEATQQAHKAIEELDELLATGFRGDEVQLTAEMILKLFDIEKDTDLQQIQVRSELFEIENKLNPVDVMFLYELIKLTGELADRSQTVGSQLQLLLAK